MTYQVLTNLKVKTKQGEMTLSPGQIINLNPSKAESWIAQGKIKPISSEGTPDAILSDSIDRIIEKHKGMQYKTTEEIRKAEDEADRIYKKLLQGQGSISDFQKACDEWVSICSD